MSKKCIECGEIKNLDEFYKHSTNKDGLNGKCKTCTKEYEKNRRTEVPEYGVWRSMINRCTNPIHARYKDYGGRGIKVCARWLESFENFLKDVGQRPGPDLSIDRIDNDGDYEPGNIRWATRQQQMMNKRVYSNNTSGYPGVSWDKAANKWKSQIKVNNENNHLGLFDNKDDAIATRKRAEQNISRCSKCDTYKLLKEFTRSKNSPQGVHGWCRECLYEAKNTKKSKKRTQKYNQRYYQSTVKPRRQAAKESK